MTTWMHAVPLAALEPDGIAAADVGGLALALFRVDGAIHATDDLCTHGQARLSDGFLDGWLVECPLHQGLFDVRTGAPAGAPCVRPVRTYPVKVEDGAVFVAIE